jgi:hypothetical protein
LLGAGMGDGGIHVGLQFLVVSLTEIKARARGGEQASHGGVIRDRRRA